MRVVAIIQARLGSTRLPGKVLLPLCGKPILQHIFDRVSRAKSVEFAMVAVPTNDLGRIVEACDIHAIPYKGDENDLVARYLAVARVCSADIIVRICADNPCVQPEYIDAAVEEYLETPWIFYSNTTERVVDHDHYGVLDIDGLGCEVLSLSRLKWLDSVTRGNAEHREHLHRYFQSHAGGAEYGVSIGFGMPVPDLRLDVNTQADYEFIKDIYEHCYPTNPQFGIEEIVAYLGPDRIREWQKQHPPG